MTDPALLVPFTAPAARGTLRRRYKRFFADCVLDDGTAITAHTANTGSMKGLLDEGNPVLLTHHAGTARKLPWSLEAIGIGGCWVGCNTAVPNTFVERAVKASRVPSLAGYRALRREVKYGEGLRSRIDVLLEDHVDGRPPCFVEVKNVTLREGRRALFPDAVTERGLKHIEDLVREIERGARGAFVFVAQRTDCDVFAPAYDLDEDYAVALADAARRGLEIVALQASVDARGVSFVGALDVDLARPARASVPAKGTSTASAPGATKRAPAKRPAAPASKRPAKAGGRA